MEKNRPYSLKIRTITGWVSRTSFPDRQIQQNSYKIGLIIILLTLTAYHSFVLFLHEHLLQCFMKLFRNQNVTRESNQVNTPMICEIDEDVIVFVALYHSAVSSVCWFALQYLVQSKKGWVSREIRSEAEQDTAGLQFTPKPVKNERVYVRLISEQKYRYFATNFPNFSSWRSIDHPTLLV